MVATMCMTWLALWTGTSVVWLPEGGLFDRGSRSTRFARGSTSGRRYLSTRDVIRRASSFTYCIAPAMVKIGRYMAITMNPITTPRNTIIMGSSSEVRVATAVSTSSS